MRILDELLPDVYLIEFLDQRTLGVIFARHFLHVFSKDTI